MGGHGKAEPGCPFPLRRHQSEALAAITAAREGGATRWWVTMPPGAGKTLVGTELARVLGRRVVAFSPNTAIQEQWARTWAAYGVGPAGTDRVLEETFNSLTYQALATFDNEDSGAEDSTEDADPGPASLVDRLHPNGAALIAELRAAGPLLLILDECHHLLEVWGRLLEEVLAELPDAMVLGLTATPPDSMSRAQQELASALFGPILYEARTPALVKTGHLAPYAELAWLVAPTPTETAWLDEQSVRWAELRTDLTDPRFGSTSFLSWLDQRFVEPTRSGKQPWASFVRDEPELAEATLRMAHAGLLELPTGAVVHEEHQVPATSADWVRLLDDWLLHCVCPSEDPRDAEVLEAVRRTLPSIDYVWTRRGIRVGTGSVDRVLARSAAKQTATVTILAAEAQALGARTRALVLTDFEQASAVSTRRLGDTSSPDPAGSAMGTLQALLADPDTAALAPLLVTGRTVAGAEETLHRLVRHVAVSDAGLAARLVVDGGRLSGPWRSGRWVREITDFFAAGGTRALVGTRGLLGEGWDAPAITTLVDLTTVTTATAVTQTRGRALRIDPNHPDKTALIWSPVCVHPGHVSGNNDWDRFRRKHAGHFTMDQLGNVVDGVAGVDVEFTPFHPPSAAEFDTINARMAHRGEDRGAIREAWLASPDFDDVVRSVVRVRADRPSSDARRAIGQVGTRDTALTPWAQRTAARSPAGPLAVCVVAAVLVGILANWTAGVSVLLLGGLLAHVWAGCRRLAVAGRDRVDVAMIAAAVADGMRDVGLSAAGSEAVRREVLPTGEVGFTLTDSEQASQMFADSLAEAMDPVADPRYLIGRWHETGPGHQVGRWLGNAWRWHPTGQVWHQVPTVFGGHRDRVRAYERAWQHWVGGSAAVWTRGPEGTGVLTASRGSDPFSVTCVIRTEWS